MKYVKTQMVMDILCIEGFEPLITLYFYHSFLYQQTGFYMNLSGKFEENLYPGTNVDAWFLTPLDGIYGK